MTRLSRDKPDHRPLTPIAEVLLIAIGSGDIADRLGEVMRANPLGREACVIGEVAGDPTGIVSMVTDFFVGLGL